MGNPELHLLDQLPEGIAPLVVRQMLEHLLALNRSGATILLSEQNLDFSLRLADCV